MPIISQRFKEGLMITLIAIGVLLAVPVLLPYAFISLAIDGRRLRQDAARFTCVVCGQVLGEQGLAMADEAGSQQREEFHRKHPNVKYRQVRTLYAICRSCGARYNYTRKDRAFVLNSEAPAGGPEPVPPQSGASIEA